MNAQDRQVGFALPLVLWLMVAMIFTVTLLARAATDRHLQSRALSDRVAGEAAAIAGVHYGIAQMDSRRGHMRWRPNGEIHRWQFGSHDVLIKIRDESGKLDLNTVDLNVLDALMHVVQISNDEIVSVVEGVAEIRTSSLSTGNPLWRSQDLRLASFQSIGELTQLHGVSARTLATLAPYLTVHSRLSLPNSSVADAAVRTALLRAGRVGGNAAAGQAGASGIYDVSADATNGNGVTARVHVVLKHVARYDGNQEIKWLVWEHGRWQK